MLRKAWRIVLLWLCCTGVLAAVPERPRFRIVGSSQGLPSTEIKALAHDAAGYLWIATADGLARHDGIGVRVWRHDPADPRGLPGNNVQALMVDAADRVWVAVEGAGISVLDARRQSFSHYRKSTHAAIGSDDTWAFARQGGTVWFGTYEGGLHRMDGSGRIRRYHHDPAVADGLPSDTILSLAVDGDGALWIGTDGGLARMQDGALRSVRLPGAKVAPMVYSTTLQSDGLWVGTAAGVWRRNARGWSQPAWSPMFERPNAMTGIVRDDDGAYWIASQRGLWRQRGADAPVPVRTGGPDIPRGITTLLRQPGGGLWVPVTGVGLGYLRADWRRSARYSGPGDGLQGAMYRALAPARAGGLWLGGYNGAVERLGADGSIVRLDADSSARLANVKLSAIAEDREGRLWLGRSAGLIRIGLDGVIDEWRAGDAEDPAPAGVVHQMQVAADGSIWLSAPGGGVQQRDVATGKVLIDIQAGEDGIGDADLEALQLSPRGEVWIASGTGVARLDRVHRRFRAVPEMGAGRVYALAFDGDDHVWVQRISGLEDYVRRNGRWQAGTRVGAALGMPAVAASGLRVDARHRVWITTPRGLYRWDPRSRNLRRLGVQDDTGSSQEFLDRALAVSAQGLLGTAGADGSITLIETDAPDLPAASPLLRVDRASVRRHGQWQELALRTPLQLERQDREFRIGARLLAFEDPASNRYWAKLEGFDREWVALDASGERVFSGLAPGRYTLRVRARDAAGNPAREQVMRLQIPPPWWATAWARALFALTALLLLAGAAWLYRARLKRRHAWQLAEAKQVLAEQASEAKSRFLATLGHEVRTPMTGVLGMSELLQGTALDARQRSHVDAIRRAGEHLLRLVNDALDLARIEAGKLELVNADFAVRPLLDEVAALMAPVAERKGLQFLDALDPATSQALHGDRTRLQQILLNLLNNAIKFTEHGHVSVEVGPLEPQGLRVVVADSGPGLSAEQRGRLFRRFEQAEGARTAARYGGSGLGLAISQELAAAMGGRIDVESEPGQGSRFIVELPLATAQNPGSVLVPALDARAPELPGLRLLLVEDDPIVAQALQGLLAAQGHQVVHAGHGLAALSEAAVQSFDAALLDLDLPGMDGLALARTLRAQGFAAPLLAVTARSDAEAETLALAAGFDHFLRKPVTGVMLAHALRGVVPG